MSDDDPRPNLRRVRVGTCANCVSHQGDGGQVRHHCVRAPSEPFGIFEVCDLWRHWNNPEPEEKTDE